MASHAPALLLYAALTVAITWPVTTSIGSVVPHDLGDPLLSTYTLWWNARVLPFSDRWWDGLGFYPAPNTLTFSDHRVGIGIFTTPLLLGGVSPLAAHNVAFLLTFFLSASTAYALCFVLTRNHGAAFVGGLVFGFNPYRADHLPHLELLSSYWLPVILLAIHRWMETRAARWLALLGAALLMQALTSGYYFFFAFTLLGMSLLWFTPRDVTMKQLAAVGVTLVTPLLLITPILLRYRKAHAELGLSRSITQIEDLSADLLGLITAPDLLALWNSPASWMKNEGALFPGAVAVALIAAALLVQRGAAIATPAWLHKLRRGFLLVAGLFFVVALVPAIYGPVRFEFAGLRVSTSNAYKPLSMVALFGSAWVLTAPMIRAAVRRRSPLEFYVLATLMMWLFALGPTAHFAGNRILYKAPYAWLMLVPAFRDAFRVPARFAMLATLTLSAAAAVAIWKLVEGRDARTRLIVISLVSVAIVAESWISPFPVVSEPAPLQIPAAVPGDAVIAELPFGSFEDGVAAYHSMSHQRRTLNGISGYDPPHQPLLRRALLEGEVEALRAVATERPIAIFVRRDREGAEIAAGLRTRTPAQPIASTDAHDVFMMPRETPDVVAAPLERTVAVKALSSNVPASEVGKMLDNDRMTGWTTSVPQAGGEEVVVDLGASAMVEGVALGLGGYVGDYPRLLAIELSDDAQNWNERWRGATATRAVSAALRDPLNLTVYFPFASSRARYIRLRQLGSSRQSWSIAQLTVIGATSGH